MAASITLTPVPSTVTSGAPGSYTRGEELQLDWSVRNTAGTLEEPDELTFTVRTPDGVDTDYTMGGDAEITNNADGTGTLVLVLDQSARWLFRCVTDTPTTAATIDVMVERDAFEDSVVPVPASPGATYDGGIARVASGVYSPYLATEEGETLTATAVGSGFSWQKRRGWIYPDVDLTGAVDGAAAIQAALNTRAGACVKLPGGSVKIASALTCDLNGVTLVGEDEGATEIYVDIAGSTATALMFDGSQYNGVVGLKFRGGRIYTGGPAVQFSGTFMAFAERVRVDHLWGGIDVVNSTESRLNHITTRALYGEYSVWFRGTAGNGSYRCVLDTGLFDIPYPNAYPVSAVGIGAMARSTAYSLNDIRTYGGYVWQCTTAGTTAGSGGPSLPAVSDPGLLFSTAVTDGTAAWKFVCRTAHAHVLHDSFGYTLVVAKVATLNGHNPLVMRDALNTGSSEPHFLFVSELETDHNFGALALNKGAEIRIANSSLGATLGDHVVRIDSGITLDCGVHACKVYGGQKNGFDVGANGVQINACAIGNNSQAGSGSYNGINIGSDVDAFQITNNKSLNSGSGQNRGCIINDGSSDDYIVSNNDFRGNVTEGFYDGGSGSNKIVTPNID